MAKFSCEIKKLLVLGADPSFLLKKNVYINMPLFLQEFKLIKIT